MSRRDWSKLRSMNKEQLKDEWEKLSLELEGMSKWVGNINDEEQYNKFMDEFGNALDSLHGLRNATQSMYFNA